MLTRGYRRSNFARRGLARRGHARRGLARGALLLVTVAGVLAAAAGPAAAHGPTVSPFLVHYVYRGIPGHRGELKLVRLEVDGVPGRLKAFAAVFTPGRRSTTFVQSQSGSTRIMRARRAITVGARSQLLVSLAGRDQIGRYKFYRIDPRRRRLSVSRVGCTPPGFILDAMAFAVAVRVPIVACHPKGMISPGSCTGTGIQTPFLPYPCDGAIIRRGARRNLFAVYDANPESALYKPYIDLSPKPPDAAGVLPVDTTGDGVFAQTTRVPARPRQFHYTDYAYTFPGFWTITPGKYYVQVQQIDAPVFYSRVAAIYVR
ncbi:MAG: hypothetical protein ACR2NR_02920 [Solirubrobacteraceae bacterium]